ncbi:MAG: hypothetical protein ACKO46_04780, partial [Alphaproteobacteria bacterium]
ILRAIRHACADKQAGVIHIYTNAETLAYIMNFKKKDIISTEINYGVHIFMNTSDEVGAQGFTIKKRKNLSDDERREIEMSVETGKVNQMEIEKNYFEEVNSRGDDDFEDEDEFFKSKKPHDNNRNHRHHDHKKHHKKFDNKNRNRRDYNEPKKSFFSFLFGR